MASSEQKMESVGIKRKKKIRKCTDRENAKFMELYETEEVLWNVRLAEYKNKELSFAKDRKELELC